MLKWKRDWWQAFSWNESGIDEKNIAEVEAGVMNKVYLNGSGSDENNVAEMEAELTH